MPPTPLLLDREALARDIHRLPSLPPIVLELMNLVRTESPLGTLGETLSLDQALSAKVLQLANSPFYGVSGRVASIRDGISILGTSQLTCMVMAAALTLQFEERYGQSLHLDSFWKHSVGCAVAAKHVAMACGLDSAAAFSAGLLHDVGRLVIESHYPQEVAQALAWSETNDLPQCDAEQSLLGICHVEIGGWVSRHWCFAPEIVQAIEHHHWPTDAPVEPLTDVVHIADAITHALDLCGDPMEVVPWINEAAWTRLQLTEDKVHALLGQIEQEFRELAQHLRPARGMA